MATEAKFWTGKAPETCQLCSKAIDKDFIDGRIAGQSSWGHMCPACHFKLGAGLGTGKGQSYHKIEDGRWMKIDG